MVTARLDEAVQAQVDSAVRLLRKGGVVAIPTDTLYGLAACAFDEAAVRRVFELKGRPDAMAMPLLASDADAAFACAAEVPEAAVKLARAFWPGALSLVLKRSTVVSDAVSGGRDTVALRVPAHPVPRVISRDLGTPITGTSANRSGRPGLADAEAVRRELGDGLDLVVDWNETLGGVASAVLDLSGAEPVLLREGAVSRRDLEAALGLPLLAANEETS